MSYTIRTLNLSGTLAVDNAGNAYFATEDANAVFRVDALTGQATRFAGTGKAGYSGDNGPPIKLGKPVIPATTDRPSARRGSLRWL